MNRLHSNIERQTEENTHFRQVPHTGHKLQLVLMTIQQHIDGRID